MVMGVVPRYDPQGMGLPMLPPSTMEGEGRPRAATLNGESSREVKSSTVPSVLMDTSVSYLEVPIVIWLVFFIRHSALLSFYCFVSTQTLQLPAFSLGQQSSPVAQVAARRPIPRSNSSPVSGSMFLGDGVRGDGVGIRDAVGRSAVPAREASGQRGNYTRNHTSSADELSLRRGWGSSGSIADGGGESSSSDGLGDYGRRSVSAPLLGSFPFSIWNLVQFSSSRHAGWRDQDGGRREPLGASVSGAGAWTEEREYAGAGVASAASGRGVEGGNPSNATATAASGVRQGVDTARLVGPAATTNLSADEIVISGAERAVGSDGVGVNASSRPHLGVVNSSVGERDGSGNAAGRLEGIGGIAGETTSEEASLLRGLLGDEIDRSPVRWGEGRERDLRTI